MGKTIPLYSIPFHEQYDTLNLAWLGLAGSVWDSAR